MAYRGQTVTLTAVLPASVSLFPRYYRVRAAHYRDNTVLFKFWSSLSVTSAYNVWFYCCIIYTSALQQVDYPAANTLEYSHHRASSRPIFLDAGMAGYWLSIANDER